jgi:hypothetical protein
MSILVSQPFSENFPKKLFCEEKFVQYEAFVAGKKLRKVILTATQQETHIVVATSLQHLSVNLRPDF